MDLHTEILQLYFTSELLSVWAKNEKVISLNDIPLYFTKMFPMLFVYCIKCGINKELSTNYLQVFNNLQTNTII